VLIPKLLGLLFLLLLTPQPLQPSFLQMAQTRRAPPRLMVLACRAAASLVIINQHRLLGIRFDRFAKHHRSFANILNDHINIADFRNVIGGGLLRINLHRLGFALLLIDAIFLL
jgi:hypothetical protein